MHTWGIEKLPGHVNVEAHAHSGGRYKLAIGHPDQSEKST